MRRKLGPALNRAFGTAPGVARDLDVRVVMSPAIELVNALFSRVQVPACVQPVTVTAHENLGAPAGADCPLAVDFRLGCEQTVEHHNITENLDFRVRKFEPDKASAIIGKSTDHIIEDFLNEAVPDWAGEPARPAGRSRSEDL